jgi:hypothetical protein
LTEGSLPVRNEFLRGSLAILLACLAPAAVFVSLPLTGRDPIDPKGLLFLAFLATVFAFVGVFAVGLPVNAFLRHKSWTGYRHYTAAGLISGLALGFLASLARNEKDSWIGILGFCLLSTASALGFRLGLGKP